MSRPAPGGGAATVCAPLPRLAVLFWARLARRRVRAVSFVSLPGYGKVITRWLRVPEPVLLAAYGRIAGVPVVRAAPERGMRGSARLNLQAMTAVSRIAEVLAPEIVDQSWTVALGRVTGRREALAYMQRQFAALDIWPQVFAIALTRAQVQEGDVVALWSSLWPDPWRRAAADELRGFDAELAALPEFHRQAVRGVATLGCAARAVLLTIGRLARFGCRRVRIEPAAATTEFIDPLRMGGEASDTNFLEDPPRIRREDLVYFLTSRQARALGWRRAGKVGALNALRASGFRIVDLRRAGYTRRAAAILTRMLPDLRVVSGGARSPCLGSAYVAACDEVATLLLLFSAVRPQAIVHTFAPNGRSTLRYNSAIVTGLARRFGVRSVGHQTRITYDSVYEDSFDCYETYLAWGADWRKALTSGSAYIDEVVVVGCTDNDGIAAEAPSASGEVVVGVLTAELEGTMPTLRGAAELLKACCDLARGHPTCRFEIKTRDPEDVERLLEDGELRRAHEETAGRLRFVELPRHEVRDFISRAHIVIATAWTTPGGLALMLQRRVIYYDVIGGGGIPFRSFPDLVASSPTDLARLFELALRDFPDYGERHAALLAGLDPFRDGRALARVREELLRSHVGEAAPATSLGGDPVA